jgi:hypothetical protein
VSVALVSVVVVGGGAVTRLDGFVGREEAVECLGEELAGAEFGPRLVWMVGEAGIGKTALLRRWLSEIGEQPVWVSGALEERELPLGLVEQLVDALARRGGGGGVVRVGKTAVWRRRRWVRSCWAR